MVCFFISENFQDLLFHNEVLYPCLFDDVKEGDDVAMSQEERSVNETEGRIKLKVVSYSPAEEVTPFLLSALEGVSCFKTDSCVPFSINHELSTVFLY